MQIPSSVDSQVESASTNHGSLGQRAASGVGWITLEMIGIQGTSLIVFAIVAHFVDRTDFGLMSISLVVVQTVKTLFLDGVAVSVLRKPNPQNHDFSTAFWILLAFSGILSCCALLSAGFLAHIMNMPNLRWIMQQMSCMILFSGLARTHEVWLTRRFQFRQLAIRGLCGGVLGGIAAIVAAVGGLHTEAFVIQQIVATISSLILLWCVCPWRPSFSFSRTSLKETVSFSLKLFPSNLLLAVNQNTDTVLIGALFGPASAGIYNISKRLKLALQLVAVVPINGILIPVFAEVENDHEKKKAMFLRIVQLIFLICIAAYIGAASLSGIIIPTVFGPSWSSAAPIFAILAVGGALTAVSGFFDAIMTVRGVIKPIFWASTTYTAVSILLFLLWPKSYNTNFALPFVLPYLITIPYMASKVLASVSVSIIEFMRSMAGIVASIVVMAATLFVAEHTLGSGAGISKVVVLCLVGMAVYIVAIFALARDAADFFVSIARSRFSHDRRSVSVAHYNTVESGTGR